MDKQVFLENYVVERKNTGCMKWDGLNDKYGRDDLLPLWIADMEFKTCDAVVDAITRRAQDGVFGYSCVPEGYYDAFITWMDEVHGFRMEKDWIRFTTGCVTAIAWMINAFTEAGDTCLNLTPVYYPFHNVVTYNNRKLVSVDLDYDDGCFTMNYDAIEKAVIDNDVKMFLMCSPHNPAGRVWTEEELSKVLAVCKKHNVLVVSDEIHQDIIVANKKFIPAAMVDGGKYRDILLTISSASKTFNLAALSHAHIVISDNKLRARYDSWARGMNRTELNILSAVATQAAYEHGKEWMENVLEIIRDNDSYLREEMSKHLPQVKVCCLEGTYLVMLDLRGLIGNNSAVDFIQNKCKLAVDYGEWFGENFKGFIRMNLATDPKFIKQAVSAIVEQAKKL